MSLTLNQESSPRVSEVVLPPRLGRNEECHCGSGSKYKRCCREHDEALRRQLRGATVPAWIDNSRGKLHQFEKYVCNVFSLPDLLASIVDTRRAPKIPTFEVVNSLFHTALLRIPSIALEGDLKQSDFQKLIGRQPTPDTKAFSADVVANVLDKLELQGIRKANEEVISKAERNKAFRDGSYGALRCVAIDGWEHSQRIGGGIDIQKRKAKQIHSSPFLRKGLVTHVSGPRCNGCSGTLSFSRRMTPVSSRVSSYLLRAAERRSRA